MSSSNTHHLPTSTAYDMWSTVYDTDGNVLQQLDDIYISTHLPPLIPPHSNNSGNSSRTVVELGCGTGRNTLKLAELGVHVLAVDNSRGMLNRLEEKIAEREREKEKGNDGEGGLRGRIEVFVEDLSTFSVANARESPFKAAVANCEISGVVSTLVLEHLTLPQFFSVASTLLPPAAAGRGGRGGGWLLLTNMHWEMGAISSAGFLDTATGRKIKPVSMNHTKDEILAEAEKWGFVLDGPVSEEGIRDLEHASGFGRRAEKWVGVLMHFGAVFRRV